MENVGYMLAAFIIIWAALLAYTFVGVGCCFSFSGEKSSLSGYATAEWFFGAAGKD